jgi:hypothetical protein
LNSWALVGELDTLDAAVRLLAPAPDEALALERVQVVSPDDHARDADPGRAAARADDGRDHRVDEPAGIAMSKTGRYKRYPVIGLGLMTAALVLMAVLVPHPSRTSAAIGPVVLGLGFGMVGQVLIAAVQNSVP